MHQHDALNNPTMSTHTEDTKEMKIVQELEKMLSNRKWGADDKSYLSNILTLFASQVREERDREILTELDRLDGDTTEPIPSRKHNWYYGYADCLVEVKKFITTLTQKT